MSAADFLFPAQGSGTQIMHGSIGWEDDDAVTAPGTGDNDGHTMVKVQLFEGRDITKPLNPDRAQGHKILCHLSGGMFRLPKKDTRVVIAVPNGLEHVSGAGVIFASIEKSSSLAITFEEDRAVIDFGGETHVAICGKSVSMMSYDKEFVAVGTPRSGGTSGVTIQAKDGTGAVFQEDVASLFVGTPGGGASKCILQMSGSLIQCLSKDGGMWQLNDKGFVTVGTEIGIIGAAVYLGKAPIVSSPVAYGPAGVGVSPSVFVSPV